MLYHAYIVSHVRYCLITWGTLCDKRNYNIISKCILKCCRNIFGKNFRNFIKMRHYDLNTMIRHILQILGYRVEHNDLLNSIMSIFNSANMSNICTRNRNLPRIPKHKSKKYNESFICKFVLEYSKLPLYVWNKPSLKMFKRMLYKLPD